MKRAATRQRPVVVPLLMNGRQRDKRSMRHPKPTFRYGTGPLNDVKYSTRDGHPGSRTVAAFVRGSLPGYARPSVGLQTNNLSRFRRTHVGSGPTVARVGGRSRPKRKTKKIHRSRRSRVFYPLYRKGMGVTRKTDLDRSKRGFFCGIIVLLRSFCRYSTYARRLERRRRRRQLQ